ncbi:MAG: hypothetical protein JOZ56_06490 [Actinobacteria bacterium]|nr:hypothetical protein [Actinomycetota bacterium]MBV8562721.1 hypothetical protein [Actinomycetota bacterium]
MNRLAVVVPLRPERVADAQALIAEGPPFDLSETDLEEHYIFISGNEAVFVFNGPDAKAVLEQVVGESHVWEAASEWRKCLDGKPRLAETAFAWKRHH